MRVLLTAPTNARRSRGTQVRRERLPAAASVVCQTRGARAAASTAAAEPLVVKTSDRAGDGYPPSNAAVSDNTNRATDLIRRIRPRVRAARSEAIDHFRNLSQLTGKR